MLAIPALAPRWVGRRAPALCARRPDDIFGLADTLPHSHGAHVLFPGSGEGDVVHGMHHGLRNVGQPFLIDSVFINNSIE